MISSDPPLKLATAPPSMPEAYVARPELLDRLEGYLDRRLILVQAPAGYGKSTLVAALSVRIDRPVCWLRLSPADQDVMRLASLLRTSLTTRFHRLRDRLNFDPHPGAAPRALAQRFAEPIRQAVPEPFLLVFDDVQWINRSDEASAFMDALLGALPENATVVLAGRELPRVSLPEMVMDGVVGGVGMRDLALSPQELAEVLEQRLSIEVDSDDLEQLYERTQGWITGALLFAVSPERETLASLVPEVVKPTAFFAETVLSQVSDQVRTFLLESAALPKLTAEACDDILDREDSKEKLAFLLRKGYFITALQTEPRSYEYHPLFRESLIELLDDSDPERLRELRIRAAEHFAEEGAVEEAFELYMASGSPEQAGQLAEDASRALFSNGQIATLERWASTLYQAQIEAPNLLLYVATAACDVGDYTRAGTWLKRARVERDLQEVKDRPLLARALNVEGRLALEVGEPARAQQLAQRVLELLPDEGEPARRSEALRLLAISTHRLGEDLSEAERYAEHAVQVIEGSDHTHTRGLALLDLTHIRLTRGRHLEAHRSSERAHQLLTESGSALSIAISLNNQAYIAHMNGRYDQAFDLFQQAIENARSAESLRYEAVILFGQADLFNDLGLRFQAGDLYGEGLRAATRISHTSLIGYGHLQTSTLHRRAGNTSLAREWLAEAAKHEGSYTTPAVIQMHEAALIIDSHPSEARSRLRELHDDIGPAIGAQNLTMLQYFQSLAAAAAEDPAAAERHLRRALDTAGSQGTQQLLAAELLHDSRLMDLANELFPDDPLVMEVRSRLDFMTLVSRRFDRQTERSERIGAKLHMRALGRADIRVEGRRITSLPPLPRSLLFYLADKGPAARDRILETFWPQVPADKQTSSLYTAVHGLKSALGKDCVEIEAGLYRLNRSWSIHYDVAEFERTSRIARDVPKGDPRRTFALAEAVEAYTGDFLPGYHEDWVLQRRRALKTDLLKLLTERAAAASAEGQHEAARQSLQRALTIDPLRDDLHFSYMQVLTRLGRRSEMITHYHEYARRLANELGVDPPADVRRFYQEQVG